jgi:hypothetical protein
MEQGAAERLEALREQIRCMRTAIMCSMIRSSDGEYDLPCSENSWT